MKVVHRIDALGLVHGRFMVGHGATLKLGLVQLNGWLTMHVVPPVKWPVYSIFLIVYNVAGLSASDCDTDCSGLSVISQASTPRITTTCRWRTASWKSWNSLPLRVEQARKLSKKSINWASLTQAEADWMLVGEEISSQPSYSLKNNQDILVVSLGCWRWAVILRGRKLQTKINVCIM